jgi:hypothetical protein
MTVITTKKISKYVCLKALAILKKKLDNITQTLCETGFPNTILE